jgi:transcriptional regulator with XRE-family HTH domain
VNDAELGGIVRALRHRRGWRQIDLASEAGVSAALVGLFERGRADSISVRNIRRIGSALELRLGWDAGYRGPELARLRDADHARLAEWLARRLERDGWTVVPEASYNHYGDRGRVDLLAFHPTTQTLVVVEVKTVIAEIQDLLGALSTKERVAPGIARSLGWRAAQTVPFLVVAESTTNRRRLTAHARLFARLGVRGKSAVAWIRRPDSAPSGLLLLVKLPDHNRGGARRAGRQRVRLTKAALSVDGSGDRAAAHA